MAKHTGLPESGADHSADSPSRDPGLEFSQDFDQDDDPAPASPPARFGRLALWVASASALTVGVLATVAYGVWFDQDQRAYAKAMTVAQQTLSAGVVTMPKRQTLAAGVTIAPEQQTLPPVAAPCRRNRQRGRVVWLWPRRLRHRRPRSPMLRKQI